VGGSAVGNGFLAGSIGIFLFVTGQLLFDSRLLRFLFTSSESSPTTAAIVSNAHKSMCELRCRFMRVAYDVVACKVLSALAVGFPMACAA